MARLGQTNQSVGGYPTTATGAVRAGGMVRPTGPTSRTGRSVVARRDCEGSHQASGRPPSRGSGGPHQYSSPVRLTLVFNGPVNVPGQV